MRKGMKYSRSLMILSSLCYITIAHSRLLIVWTNFLSFVVSLVVLYVPGQVLSIPCSVRFVFLSQCWAVDTANQCEPRPRLCKELFGMCYVTGETLRPQIPEACSVQCNPFSCPRDKKLIYPLCLRTDKASTQRAKTALSFSTDLGKGCVQKTLSKWARPEHRGWSQLKGGQEWRI